MSINIQNLIAAFSPESGKSADTIWLVFQRYLDTTSEKQGSGVSRILFRESQVARESAPGHVRRMKGPSSGMIKAMNHSHRSLRSEDLGGPFLLHYAIETLLTSSDPVKVSPSDFSGLFRSITGSEFDSILSPAIARAVRRSPSKSIANVCGILERCSVDMSGSFTDLVSALVDSVNNSDLIELIARALGAIFRQCALESARLQVVKHISAAFPRFGQQSIDIAAATVLSSLSRCGRSSVRDKATVESLLSSGLVAGLVKQLRVAPSDETKCRIATSLSDLVALTMESTDLSIITSGLKLMKDDLVSQLSDKKSSESLKSAIIIGIETVCDADRGNNVTFSALSLDGILPFLGMLSQGRFTARTTCLAAWSVALHCAQSEETVDKKLSTVFAQCVASDATLCPLLGEDSATNRALLLRIHTLALRMWNQLPLISGSENETVTIGSPPSERMKNRFCANLLKTIACTSATSLKFPEDVASSFANRLALAMYEIMTMDRKSLPGHLGRVAMDSVFSLIHKMEPDWIALCLVMSQHEYLSSHRMSVDKVWKRLTLRQPRVSSVVKLALDSITGLMFQGAETKTEFRNACMRIACILPEMGISSESMVSIANAALDRLTPDQVSAVAEDLPIYFCPEQVVWRSDTEDWIPSPETTLKVEQVAAPAKGSVGVKKPAPVVSSGVTREDMMRETLKQQSMTRKKIAEIANRNQFSLSVISSVLKCDDRVGEAVSSLITARMSHVLTLLKSPLTSEASKELVKMVSSILGFPDTSSAMYLVSLDSVRLMDDEDWIALFNTISACETVSKSRFVWPLFQSALSPSVESDFRPEVTRSALETLIGLHDSPFDLQSLLRALRTTCTISAAPFASLIGKLLRLIGPNLQAAHGALFADLAVSDEPRLVTEIASSVHKLPMSLVESDSHIVSLVLMGSFEEAGQVTSDLLPLVQQPATKDSTINHLVSLLRTEALIQRLSAQALAYIAAEDSACLSLILSRCESEFVGTSESRFGIATALKSVSKISSAGTADFLSKIVRFVVTEAMEVPDLTVSVRDELLACLQEALTTHGETHALSLLSLAESFIGKTSREAAGLAVPVVLGLLTKFLPPLDARVESVRTKLVAQLLTAEASVQTKIAGVMPPLLKMSDDVPKYLETFLNTALSTSDPRARYGAALGVGAAAKAQGVAILRQMEVLKKLQEATEDSKNHDKRQGAIAVYGGLSLALGRLFEPYVAQILPVLLIAFGDGNSAVREASNLAASQIMTNLSSHGIKLVLPSLLAGVEDLQWRTKLGSIKLLSAMLRCAPKQLSTCLPRVVPAISDVATDTHSKVREAACASLAEIESIISNPEIKSCSQKLIASLTDPANDHLRQEALDVLLSTSFVHSLDAASLALVIPVMLRATKERRSEIKRKGAQILGSVAVLSADPIEGLGPYMDTIIPALQDVLVDPIPDVRATAAKAMGTMARALPETMVAQVLPWLFKTLKEAESQVERSGAAHGLSEVLVELGPDHFTTILPQVVENAVNPDTNPEAREGYLGLFIFLPSVMRNAFVAHIELVFPVLISGLSDPLQPVREVAYRAANSICAQFGATHATLLMPSLERGLFAKDWRARHASVLLIGQTLETLMKNSRGGNRDNLLESQVSLTQEKRSYMLAMLYIVRSDMNPSVNQNAQSVWKNVVSNTPRTLRMILPILVRLLIANLSSSEEETRQVLAGRCLGDLVGKLGDRVLPDLVPILVDNINSVDPMVRAGVCVGLSDIVTAAHRQLLQEYFSIMFPAVRAALCDESCLVRSKAGSLISLLYTTLGNTTINNTVPQILEAVQSEDAEVADKALPGLRELVQALPKEILLQVVDVLMVAPVTAAKIRGIETISVAPATEIAKHVTRVIGFLMSSYAHFPNDALHAGNELFGHLNRHAYHLALIELIRGLGDKSNAQLREACASLIASCVKCAPLEVVAEYMDTLIPVLVRGTLVDPYQPAMESCLLALGEIITKFTKENMIKYMRLIADTVENVLLSGNAPGLGLPRAFETLWSVYQQALMFGSTDAREASASGLVILLNQTPDDRLKPNAIKVTGPLIRVLGDKYPTNVRVCLLQSLQVLLERLGAALKPFLPQLQTTYQKCAQDPEDSVRALAEQSQVLLAKLSAKPVVAPTVQ